MSVRACTYSVCLCVSVHQTLIHAGPWAVRLCLGASLCVYWRMCQGSFFQVNPLRRGVVLFLAPRSLSSLSLTVSAVSSHALSLLSSSHLFLSAVVVAVAASLRDLFLSACHLCISSHLLLFLCEMSSCGEMGEAIELR